MEGRLPEPVNVAGAMLVVAVGVGVVADVDAAAAAVMEAAVEAVVAAVVVDVVEVEVEVEVAGGVARARAAKHPTGTAQVAASLCSAPNPSASSVVSPARETKEGGLGLVCVCVCVRGARGLLC